MAHPIRLTFLFTVLVVAAAALFAASALAPHQPSGDWADKTNGFTLEFDPALFTPAKTAGGVTLKSPYYIIDNPSGLPENERPHYFSVTVAMYNESVMQYIAASAFGQDIGTSFPSSTWESFVPSPGFAERVTVGGKSAVRFTFGIEGTNIDYYLVPVTDTRTAVVTVNYFTDFLKDTVRPAPFSFASEQRAVNEIIQSMQFIQ